MNIRSILTADLGMIITPAWRWWVNELAECIPERLRQLWCADFDVIEIAWEDHAVEIRRITTWPLRRKQTIGVVDLGSVADVAERLSRVRRKIGTQIVLTVPERMCLRYRRFLPIAAAPKAREILELDALKDSPFQRGDVYTGLSLKPAADVRKGLAGELLIVKRASVDPLLTGLKNARVRIDALRVRDLEGQALLPNLIAGTPAETASLDTWLDRCLVGLAALAMFLVLAWGGATLKRQGETRAVLEREIASIRESVADLSRDAELVGWAVNQAQRHQQMKIDAVPFVEIWEEITRILPDHAWLTSLRLDNQTLFLDGAARSAAELIGDLSDSKLFYGVEFVTQVTRDEPTGIEKFQLRFGVRREGAVKATAQDQAP